MVIFNESIFLKAGRTQCQQFVAARLSPQIVAENRGRRGEGKTERGPKVPRQRSFEKFSQT